MNFFELPSSPMETYASQRKSVVRETLVQMGVRWPTTFATDIPGEMTLLISVRRPQRSLKSGESKRSQKTIANSWAQTVLTPSRRRGYWARFATIRVRARPSYPYD